MRRWLRWAGCGLAGLLVCGALGVLAFDVVVVRPHVARIEQVIAAAATDERHPPAAVRDMLYRAYGDRLGGQIVGQVVFESMRGGDHMGRLRRQFVELGVALLLPWHLSEAQLQAAFLASTHMGPGVRGFAVASERHLGVPLARVDLHQAARLMAIAHAPSVMLDHPARMERRVHHLMSRPARIER